MHRYKHISEAAQQTKAIRNTQAIRSIAAVIANKPTRDIVVTYLSLLILAKSALLCSILMLIVTDPCMHFYIKSLD